MNRLDDFPQLDMVTKKAGNFLMLKDKYRLPFNYAESTRMYEPQPFREWEV